MKGSESMNNASSTVPPAPPDLFSVDRMKRFAASDPFFTHTLRDRWESELYVRAIFNSHVAENSAVLRAYCRANGMPTSEEEIARVVTHALTHAIT